MKARVIPLVQGERPPPGISDEALIAACAVGDRGALALLFERHGANLRRFCARIAGPSDADDLLQTTFLAAWTGVRRFRGHSSVRAWLLAIAANQARKMRRGEQRRRVALEALGSTPLPSIDGADAHVARRELLARLARGIAELPHDLRVAYVMCEVEDVPGAEAARALDVRLGTLWRRLHEARQRLLPALRGER